jgi:hypothetical protein
MNRSGKTRVSIFRIAYRTGLMIIGLCLVGRFLIWQLPVSDPELIVTLLNAFLYPAAFAVALTHFLAVFEPLKEKPDWSRVYSELKQSDK